MIKRLLILIASALCLLATSCIEHNVVIKLNKDGSGTIMEETVFGAQASAMLGQMAAMGGEEAEDPLGDMADEAKAKEKAAEMGEGVSVEKVEAVDEDGKKGARVTYAFKDINQVKFTFGESMTEMGEDMSPDGAVEEAAEDNKPIEFVYKDNVLSFKNPDADKKPEKAEGEEAAAMEDIDEAQLAMMKGMFADMRMSMVLEFPGGIEKTNASHVDGNKVTMMEFEMAALIDNMDKFKEFVAAEPETPAEIQALIGDVEGIKVETNEEIEITLK